MNTNCGLNENGALVKDAVDMIGEIKILAQSAIPSNCLPCNGAAISRTAYPELFAAIGTTYGAGDGSTTFNVPDAEGVLYGNQGRTVGAAVSDGLPDATGRLMFADFGKTIAAFANVTQEGGHNVFTGGINQQPMYQIPNSVPVQMQIDNRADTIYFALSTANAIYGASTHVQPQGITFNVVIVFE